MSSVRDIFAADYAETPYWWRAAPPQASPGDLPARVDVLVVGAGYSGLSAALETARAGRSTLVIDAEALGHGASSRNVGFVGKTLKHSLGEIVHSLGQDRGIAFYREAEAAYRTVYEVVEREGIECHLNRGGRLILSYSERQQQGLLGELTLKQKLLGEDFEVLDGPAIAEEMRTPLFVAGARLADSTTIHPGLYVHGLGEAARRAGATIVTHTRMLGISGERGAFRVETSRGMVEARDVVIATNGYASPGVPGWFRRRVIPFEGFILATEELSEPALDAILTRDRSIVDGRINLSFMRRAPDSRRIIFGSRAGMTHGADLQHVAAAVWSDAVKTLPGLEGSRISHFWSGKCAGTFDLYPHLGEHQGIHYAMGYNFGGIAMGSHLGRLAARLLLGQDAASPFRGRSFPTFPLYGGTPWFLPLAMQFFAFQDRRAIGRHPL